MQFWELTAVFTAEGFRIDKTPTEDKNARFDQALYEKYAASPYETLYERGFAPGSGEMPPSVTFLENIAARFIHEISRDADIEITREAKPPEKDLLADLLRRTPFVLGVEHVTPKWLGDIWKKLGAVFHREISSYSGSAAEYLKGKNSALNVAGRVFFHLVEHKSDDCPFAFLATYSTGSAKRVNHMPLKNALLEYKSDQNKLLALLSAVSGAAEKSDFISSLVESGELFSPLRFTPEDAYQFLRETSLYEECGIVCRVPDWWRKKGGARLSVSIGGREPAGLGLEAIMAFDPEIFLGELAMSREEIESLLTQAEGLSFIKGKWVEIDHDKLKAVLDAFGKIDDLGDMTFADAIRMQLGLSGALPAGGGVEVEVTRGEWLESLKKSLLNPSKAERVNVSGDFRAALRSYQQDGLNWLHLMGKMG
ncbi:MAG: SNF2 helicase-associated domain-containing protein, partial [Synergistaceae bacterium]|nr:SNF2 helicase-associated domain-containing protein [Synergistaceae bacterium]